MIVLPAGSVPIIAPAAPLSQPDTSNDVSRQANANVPVRSNTASAPVRSNGITAGANQVQAQESGSTTPGELTEEEQRIVRELQKRDAEVRRHELAHRTAGGPYTSAPIYQYTRGPDGKLYAVSGEVAIDVSPESTPQATIAKMEIVIRAALAPADPSSQDRAVANQAKQTKLQAQAELREERQEEEIQAAEERRQVQEGGSSESPLSVAQAYQTASGNRLSGIASDAAATAFNAIA